MVLAFGCRARLDLPDIPIVGGSPEAREAARLELDAFDGWIGPGRLQLARLIFKDLNGEYDGHYYRALDQVVVRNGLDPRRVRDVVRHELCHALDDAEDLLDAPEAVFDQFGERVSEPEPGLFDPLQSARRRRSEALARTCEIGPLGALTLSKPCPGEPALGAALAAWVFARVWTDFEPEPPWPAPGPAHVVWEAPEMQIDEPFKGLIASPTAQPAVILVELSYPSFNYKIALDLHTGENVSGAQLEHLPSESAPPADLPVGAIYRAIVGWPSGPAGALLGFPISGLDEPWKLRLLVSDGGPWSLADGCVGESASLFTADGELWYAHGDGQHVQWTALP